jgi:hypothetical protein
MRNRIGKRIMETMLPLLSTILLFASTPAQAWTRPGHMLIAAIAYRELKATDPAILTTIVNIIAQHPDPGPFQVAIGREEGEAKAIRLFIEAARWPDDIRTGPQDHPVWHHQLRPFVDHMTTPPPYISRGAAYQALALNDAVAAYPGAGPKERAVALCWVMHIVGDMHQPLHTVEHFSDRWPQGDEGGARVYVLDPETGKPITLHWFWDDSVNRSADADVAMRMAADFTARFPRAHFAAALAGDDGQADAVDHWAIESRQLAQSLAYRGDAPDALTPETAKPASTAYLIDTRAAAAERVTLAGYRLADLLRSLFRR